MRALLEILSDPAVRSDLREMGFVVGGDEEIIFDGYGVSDSSGSVVIDVGGYQKTVTLDADTGSLIARGANQHHI